MSGTPRTDAQACHVSVDRAGCITLSYSADGGYVPRLLSEQLERENAELREENSKLKKVIHDQGDEIRTLQFFNDAAFAAIDAARAKEAKP